MHLLLQDIRLLYFLIGGSCDLIALLLQYIDQVLLQLHLSVVYKRGLSVVKARRRQIDRRKYRLGLVLGRLTNELLLSGV